MAAEEDVGITEYIVPSNPGFSAVLKHRYRDFQVHEVDLNGHVAHLTNLQPPSKVVAAHAGATPQELAENIPKAVAAFLAVAGPENAKLLEELLQAALLNSSSSIPAAGAAQEPAAAAAAAAPYAGPAGAAHAPAGAAHAPAGAAHAPAGAAAASSETATNLHAGEAAAPSTVQHLNGRLSVVLQPVADKTARKAIHQFFKENPLLPPLETNTVQADGSSRVQILYQLPQTTNGSDRAAGRKRKREGGAGGGGPHGGRGGQRDAWEGGSCKFVKFILYKENMDTQVALGSVARALYAKTGTFGFAGTKDKRGITAQFVTAFKVAPERLAGLNTRLRGIRMGNFEYSNDALKLGCLQGNRFSILMRNVCARDEADVHAACQAVANLGFINYFGLQRFGTGGVPTHRVGTALLQGKFQEAVQLIMQGSPDERSEFIAARKAYLEKGDIKAALQQMPKCMVAERAVLHELQQHGATAFTNALCTIPRTLRMMYLHAYQSYVWNLAVSHRVRTYGVERAVAGDLVLLDSTGGPVADAAAHADAAEPDGPVSSMELDDAPEIAEAEAEGAAAAGTSSSAHRLASMHFVTEEEAASGQFPIQQVVLPLPGHRVLLPQHDTAKVYEEVLERDGLNMEGGTHKVREFSFASLTGDYRHIIHKPKDFSWQLSRYSDPNDDSLVSTDLELMLQQQQQQQQQQRQQTPQQTVDMEAAHATHYAAAAEHATKAVSCGTASTDNAHSMTSSLDVASAAATKVPPATTDGNRGLTSSTVVGSGDAVNPTSVPGATSMAGNISSGGGGGAVAAAAAAAPSGSSDGVGKLVALQLQFQLPPSTYATMLIRELTKASTSKAFQSTLAAE